MAPRAASDAALTLDAPADNRAYKQCRYADRSASANAARGREGNVGICAVACTDA